MAAGEFTGGIKKIILNKKISLKNGFAGLHRCSSRIKIFTFPALILVMLMGLLSGCKSYKQQDEERPETPVRGKIYISADESFKPVIDAQVEVFEAANENAKIIVQYKPEAECLKDFATDSIRMVITTRSYTKGEEKFIIDSMHAAASWNIIARDAIAVIVHPDAPDSLFSMQEIREILTGSYDKDLIPIFDGVQATSTVRYVVDSILKNDSLTKKAMAAKTSEEVIDYVARTPRAVGFIGVSWIGNKDDSTQVSFLKKVKVAQIESTDVPGGYVLPVQANIYMKRYPMVRDLVYVLKEKIHNGLGYGFARFLNGEIGQLIFKRAYLVPVHRNFILRTVQLRE